VFRFLIHPAANGDEQETKGSGIWESLQVITPLRCEIELLDTTTARASWMLLTLRLLDGDDVFGRHSAASRSASRDFVTLVPVRAELNQRKENFGGAEKRER
jgi:hypothetical protein